MQGRLRQTCMMRQKKADLCYNRLVWVRQSLWTCIQLQIQRRNTQRQRHQRQQQSFVSSLAYFFALCSLLFFLPLLPSPLPSLPSPQPFFLPPSAHPCTSRPANGRRCSRRQASPDLMPFFLNFSLPLPLSPVLVLELSLPDALQGISIRPDPTTPRTPMTRKTRSTACTPAATRTRVLAAEKQDPAAVRTAARLAAGLLA